MKLKLKFTFNLLLTFLLAFQAYFVIPADSISRAAVLEDPRSEIGIRVFIRVANNNQTQEISANNVSDVNLCQNTFASAGLLTFGSGLSQLNLHQPQSCLSFSGKVETASHSAYAGDLKVVPLYRPVPVVIKVKVLSSAIYPNFERQQEKGFLFTGLNTTVGREIFQEQMTRLNRNVQNGNPLSFRQNMQTVKSRPDPNMLC